MRTDSVPAQADPLSDVDYSELERWASLAAGVALAVVGMRARSIPRIALTMASAPLVYRGVVGAWPGVNSARGTREALGGGRGVRVDESVRVELPVTDVFAFWRQFENFPYFMTHLEAVTRLDEDHSRWVAKGPAGVRVEWTAEIINEIENKLIAWQSLPGSEVAVAGSVQFKPVTGRDATVIKVELQYAPPAGRAGALVASLFGRDAKQSIREDLGFMKQLLESGEITQASVSRMRGGRR